MKLDENAPCPCGFGSTYGACCGAFHASGAGATSAVAPTALQLMRSRYSAFALHLEPYLLRTWHSSTRPAALELDAGTKFLRLLIESHSAGGPFDTEGTVTFTAIGRDASGRFEQHEQSRFIREGGEWRYLDGNT